MDIVRIVVSGIAVAVICMAIRPLKSEWAMLIGLVFAIVVLMYLMGYLGQIVDFISTLEEKCGLKQIYIDTLLKVLAIAFLAEFGSTICQDAGENTAASYIETAGKVMVLVVALPVLKAVVDLAMDLAGL